MVVSRIRSVLYMRGAFDAGDPSNERRRCWYRMPKRIMAVETITREANMMPSCLKSDWNRLLLLGLSCSCGDSRVCGVPSRVGTCGVETGIVVVGVMSTAVVVVVGT